MNPSRAPKALLYLLAPAIAGCVASDPLDDLEDPEFRTSEVAEFEPLEVQHLPFDPAEPEPGPVPEPEPEPHGEPIGLEDLVGMPYEEAQSMFFPWIAHYAMDPVPTAGTYNAPEIASSHDGWPVHALQWKAYHESQSFFDIALASLQVITQGIGEYVHAADATHLNNFEASPVFTSDPRGDWQTMLIPDPAVGLTYAALLMHYWDTPVYVDASHNYYTTDPTHAGTVSHTIALQQLTFMFFSTTNLHHACGLTLGAQPAAALNQALNCNHAGILIGDQVSLWNNFFYTCNPCGNSIDFDPNTSLSPASLRDAWIQSWNSPGRIVFDPPDEATEEDLQGLLVLAEALADQILIPDDEGILVPLREGLSEGEEPSRPRG